MRVMILVAWAVLLGGPAFGQFDLEESHTTASLRGIDAVGAGIAWASGANGTVLRTEDGGYLWQTCTVPAGAETLDFRAVQGFDANTALVMSSGKGDLSRVYKTTDGCQTWTLVFRNPDAEGFFDAMRFARNDRREASSEADRSFGVIIGDPVNGHFPLFLTYDCGSKWERQTKEAPSALQGEALFAASNSALLVSGLGGRSFVTGGAAGARVFSFSFGGDEGPGQRYVPSNKTYSFGSGSWSVEALPVRGRSIAGGAFSFGFRGVIVGGDYQRPEVREDTAWYVGRSMKWTASVVPPHGYRSAAAYDKRAKAWLAVGTNGADVSFDDGKTWRAVPGADAAGWNAISLPFVVGSKGKIGRVQSGLLHR